jgi:glutaminase
MPTPDVNDIMAAQLTELYERHLPVDEQPATYYPPAMESQRHRLGMAVNHVDGTPFHLGDAEYAFPLHSISKVFTYAQALEDRGRTEVLRRVGVEPSGDPFNSFAFDEANRRPFNPMINAGALVAANLVHGADREEKVGRILERLRIYAANPGLHVDADILATELVSNDRNRGLSYLMRSQGMLDGDLEENVALYLSICSVTVTARDLAVMGATLANGGVNPLTGQRALRRTYVRDIVTVMTTCGMYDAAGQWAYDVGLPAKSSVSGAILVVIPNRVGAGFFSPGLDPHGNSIRSVNLCRDLSEQFGLHVFADPEEAYLGRRREPPRVAEPVSG